jgi:hypothetical protein
VPLFSLNPVPSPHLVGFSRGAPQSVAGGRWEEDSRVRMESPVLIPDAMDSQTSGQVSPEASTGPQYMDPGIPGSVSDTRP